MILINQIMTKSKSYTRSVKSFLTSPKAKTALVSSVLFFAIVNPMSQQLLMKCW